MDAFRLSRTRILNERKSGGSPGLRICATLNCSCENLGLLGGVVGLWRKHKDHLKTNRSSLLRAPNSAIFRGHGGAFRLMGWANREVDAHRRFSPAGSAKLVLDRLQCKAPLIFPAAVASPFLFAPHLPEPCHVTGSRANQPPPTKKRLRVLGNRTSGTCYTATTVPN